LGSSPDNMAGQPGRGPLAPAQMGNAVWRRIPDLGEIRKSGASQ
jgi:hypothetical protein